MDGYQQGWGRKRIGEKVQGIRSINGKYKKDQGEVKNSIGTVEAKELICMTYGHELRWGVVECWRVGECRAEGDKEEKDTGQL